MSKRLARKTRKQRFNQNYFNTIAEHMEHLIEEDIAQRESVFAGLTRAQWKSINFGANYGMSMTGRISSKFPNSSNMGAFPVMDAAQMAELQKQSDDLYRKITDMGFKGVMNVDYGALELKLIKDYAARDAQATMDLYNAQHLYELKTAGHA